MREILERHGFKYEGRCNTGCPGMTEKFSKNGQVVKINVGSMRFRIIRRGGDIVGHSKDLENTLIQHGL